MRIEYDTDESGIGLTAQYSGNLSTTRWVHNEPGGLKHRGYHYSYDKGNRLLSASYGRKTSSWSNIYQNRFNVENISYDQNGNILNLDRMGAVDFDGTNYSFGSVDQLSYTYDGLSLIHI